MSNRTSNRLANQLRGDAYNYFNCIIASNETAFMEIEEEYSKAELIKLGDKNVRKELIRAAKARRNQAYAEQFLASNPKINK